MKNHLQEIIAENISKKYGFEKEKILCFFDKNPYVNCIFPYAVKLFQFAIIYQNPIYTVPRK